MDRSLRQTPRLETTKDNCHARVHPLINLAGELLTCLGVKVRAGHTGEMIQTGEWAGQVSSQTLSHTRRFVCYVVTLCHRTEGHLVGYEHNSYIEELRLFIIITG